METVTSHGWFPPPPSGKWRLKSQEAKHGIFQCHGTPKERRPYSGMIQGQWWLIISNPLLSPYFLVEVGIFLWGCYPEIPMLDTYPKTPPQTTLPEVWGPCTFSSGAAWALGARCLGDAAGLRQFECGKNWISAKRYFGCLQPIYIYITFFPWDDIGYFSFQVKFQVECGKFQCLFHQTSILKTACLGFQA